MTQRITFLPLANSVYNIQDGTVYITKKSSSVCNKIVRECISYYQEKADIRILTHLKHAIQVDMINSACVLANDTDIILLSIAFFQNYTI